MPAGPVLVRRGAGETGAVLEQGIAVAVNMPRHLDFGPAGSSDDLGRLWSPKDDAVPGQPVCPMEGPRAVEDPCDDVCRGL